jgi:hypothetical protein
MITPCDALGAEAMGAVVRARALTADRRFLTWDLTPDEARALAAHILAWGEDWAVLAPDGAWYRTEPTLAAGESISRALMAAVAEARRFGEG